VPSATISNGQLNLGQTATPVGSLSVSGGGVNLGSGASLGAFSVTGGSINVASGVSATTVTLPTSGASVAAPAGQELTVSGQLTNNSTVSITADPAHPFKVGGTNLVNNIDSLTVQGGTTVFSQQMLFNFPNPTSQAQASSYYVPNDRAPWHTIDGSGLSGTPPNQTGSNNPNGNQWRVDASLPELIRLGGTQDAWIAYDFGSPVTIVQAHIWNYDQISSSYSSRGTQFADISMSNNPAAWADGSYTNTAWTLFSQNTTNYPNGWPESTGNNGDPGFWDTTDFNGATGQYLRLNNMAGFVNDPNGLGENNVVGLSEVQFYVLNNHPNTKVVAASGTTSTLDLDVAGVAATLGDLELQAGSELGFKNVTGITFGNLTGPQGSILDASIPLTFSGGTMGGTIQGAGSLTKVGPGTLILSGSNTYQGGTTVDAGTLTVNTSAAMPAGTSLTVAAGGTFIFDPSVSGAPVVASQGGASAVPEPGTLALLAAALVLGVGIRWKRRREG